MDRKLRLVLILVNLSFVIGLISYMWKNQSSAGGYFTLVSGGLAALGLVLAVANKPATKWVTLAACLVAIVGALAF